jgi:hypothetical protein
MLAGKYQMEVLMPEILSEQVIRQQGTFRLVRRYLRGWHPKIGILHFGYTGQETIEEVWAITPLVTFVVKDS